MDLHNMIMKKLEIVQNNSLFVSVQLLEQEKGLVLEETQPILHERREHVLTQL